MFFMSSEDAQRYDKEMGALSEQEQAQIRREQAQSRQEKLEKQARKLADQQKRPRSPKETLKAWPLHNTT